MSAVHAKLPIESTAADVRGPAYADNIDRVSWAEIGQSRYIHDYVMPLKPVIITGAFDHWPARQTWSLDFFKKNFGELPLNIDGRQLTMATLIDEVNASTPAKPAPYLRNHLLSALPAPLQADVYPMPDCTLPNWLDHPALNIRNSFSSRELYIGGAGAKFPGMHYDWLHINAYLMQLQGVKEYVAFAPDQTPLMYRRNQLNNENSSAVDDVINPDLNRFPLFAEAKGLRFKLHPSETLFVPAGWWHTALILTPSITVSVNGANAANWAQFRADFERIHMAPKGPVVARIAAAYLSLVGAYLKWRGA